MLPELDPNQALQDVMTAVAVGAVAVLLFCAVAMPFIAGLFKR